MPSKKPKHKPQSYRRLAAAAVLIAVSIALALHLYTATKPAPPENPHAPLVALEIKQNKFIAKYPKTLQAAANDIQALYQIAKEARTLHLNTFEETSLKTIHHKFPNHPFTKNTVLPDLEKLNTFYTEYHIRDTKRFSSHFTEWKLVKTFCNKQEKLKADAAEKKYQQWQKLPATQKALTIRRRAAEFFKIPEQHFSIAVDKHYAIIMQHLDTDSTLDAGPYFDMMQSLEKSFLRFFTPYHNILKLRPLQQSEPMVFILFASKAEYHKHTHTPDYVSGHYDLAGKYLLAYRSSNNEHERQSIFHEGTHQLFDYSSRIFDWPPSKLKKNVYPWVYEGIAEYFASSSTPRTLQNIGEINTLRLKTIKRLLQLDTQNRIHLNTILTIDYKSFQQESKQHNKLIYAGGWSLSYFLMNYNNGQYKLNYIEFLQSCLNGQGRPQDFKRIFHTTNLDTLNTQWRTFILTLEQ